MNRDPQAFLESMIDAVAAFTSESRDQLAAFLEGEEGLTDLAARFLETGDVAGLLTIQMRLQTWARRQQLAAIQMQEAQLRHAVLFAGRLLAGVIASG